MGNYSIDTCIFTGLPAQNLQSAFDGIEYAIAIGQLKHLIRVPHYAVNWEKDDPFFKENKYLFHALLLNNRWFDDEKDCITPEALRKLLTERDYPKTPTQKSENLFLQLVSLQKTDGEEVRINDILWKSEGWRKFYFKSVSECDFYIDHLRSEGLIKLVKTSYGGHELTFSFSMTYKGLSRAIELQKEGDKSRKCFVAMSFHPSTSAIREAIKKAIAETNYEAVIIDEQNINSDRTINDEIIANLKRCKFCIADFTLHSKGVYFESGFALGQSKKVIYTCRKDEFAGAHFDIKPLQHIIYEKPEQLTADLVNKIRAYID
jgi:hypothetical protein